MKFTTEEEKEAFGFLSTQAKLKIEFDKAETEQEKFIVCIKYASLIETEESIARLGETEPDKKIKRAVIDLIKWYLDKINISPDTIGEDEGTALSHAVFCPEAVELLLSRGANPNLVSFPNVADFFGNETPLHTIAEGLKYSNISGETNTLLTSVSLLIAAGANPYIKNKKGQIPRNCIANRTEESEDVFSPLELRFMAATEPSFAAEIKESFPGSSELLSFHEEQPKLPLSEEDLKDLALYNEGNYQKLLESKPLYHALKACDSVYEPFEFKPLFEKRQKKSNSNSQNTDLVGYRDSSSFSESDTQPYTSPHVGLVFESSSMPRGETSEIGNQSPFKHSFYFNC